MSSPLFQKRESTCLNFDDFVSCTYRFASPALEHHLVSSVIQPLSSSLLSATSEEVLPAADRQPSSTDESVHTERLRCMFAWPPSGTNVRWLSQRDPHSLSRLPLSSPPPNPNASGTHDVQEGVEGLAVGSSAAYDVVSLQNSIGLSEAVSIQPRDGMRSVDVAAVQGDDASESRGFVIVDAACGEAFLRGADVFAPGILASGTSGFQRGDEVLVIVIATARTGGQPTRGSMLPWSSLRTTTPIGHETETEEMMREGETAKRPRPPQNADAEQNAETVSSATCAACASAPARKLQQSSFFFGPAVCIGRGSCVMNRDEVLVQRLKGLALLNMDNPSHQPSRRILDKLSMETHHSSPYFLQNWSSMIPAQWLLGSADEPHFDACCRLASEERRPVRILDACAAPGGKTSQILQLLIQKAARMSDDTSHSKSVAVEVFAFERSKARHAKLVALLKEHIAHYEAATPPSCVALSLVSMDSRATATLDAGPPVTCPPPSMVIRVCVVQGDVLSSQATQCMAQTAVDEAAGTSAPSATRGPRSPPLLPPAARFDYILLDPPCTGLGLRPRILPHPHTMEDVQQSAAYQRKLMDACWAMLRPDGGRLSYSTCTITLEENEGNVEWFVSRERQPADGAAPRILEASSLASHSEGQRHVIHAMQSWNRNHTGQAPLFHSFQPSSDALCVRFGPLLGDTQSTLSTAHDGTEPILDGVGFFVTLFEKA